jgi:hypothetical protein
LQSIDGAHQGIDLAIVGRTPVARATLSIAPAARRVCRASLSDRVMDGVNGTERQQQGA